MAFCALPVVLTFFAMTTKMFVSAHWAYKAICPFLFAQILQTGFFCRESLTELEYSRLSNRFSIIYCIGEQCKDKNFYLSNKMPNSLMLFCRFVP